METVTLPTGTPARPCAAPATEGLKLLREDPVGTRVAPGGRPIHFRCQVNVLLGIHTSFSVGQVHGSITYTKENPRFRCVIR